eukprot:jgi/Picre1/31247/NNA_006601.t1
MGEKEDPTTAWQDTKHDECIMALQRRAYNKAWKLVHERRHVIETVAEELCTNTDETVSGERLVYLLKNTPYERFEMDSDVQVDVEDVLEDVGEADVQSLAELVMGRVSDWDVVPTRILKRKAEQVKEQLLNPEERKRLETLQDFASRSSLDDFPIPPKSPHSGQPAQVQ